jgi:hypothetical protein
MQHLAGPSSKSGTLTNSRDTLSRKEIVRLVRVPQSRCHTGGEYFYRSGQRRGVSVSAEGAPNRSKGDGNDDFRRGER